MQIANQTPISFVEALYTRAETYLNTQAYGPYATFFGRIKSVFLVLLYAVAYAYFLLAQHRQFSTQEVE